MQLLLALSALEDWYITEFNVHNAYFYGKLNEEIYMEQPEGFVAKGQEHKVPGWGEAKHQCPEDHRKRSYSISLLSARPRHLRTLQDPRKLNKLPMQMLPTHVSSCDVMALMALSP